MIWFLTIFRVRVNRIFLLMLKIHATENAESTLGLRFKISQHQWILQIYDIIFPHWPFPILCRPHTLPATPTEVFYLSIHKVFCSTSTLPVQLVKSNCMLLYSSLLQDWLSTDCNSAMMSNSTIAVGPSILLQCNNAGIMLFSNVQILCHRAFCLYT